MAKAISFGEFHFSTKKAVIAEAQQRLEPYVFGERLGPSDERFFLALFELHTEWEEKRGPGVQHITVRSDFHGNKCLYLHRADGLAIDCSWRHCITASGPKQVVSHALRRSVASRVMDFKISQLQEPRICPVLKTPLTLENSHAAYVGESFDALMTRFLETQGLTHAAIQVTNPLPTDLDQRGLLLDRGFEQAWLDFHAANARLQLLSAKANLTRRKTEQFP
jgi:hypothetical protein